MTINGKYRQFNAIPMKERKWPCNNITKAPIWCSVDLRDGNQALVNPMGVENKLKFFDMLVQIGFKEIEVGFPSASETEYTFIRRLIEENHIPDDVTVQVLCQARDTLIKKTFDAIKGAKNVIFHIYNATSPSQRKYNFGKSKEEIVQLALEGVRLVKKYCLSSTENIELEYSPENFTQTEIDFSLQICEAVVKEWGATPENKMILNLPSTVECCLPNHFADQIEYFCENLSCRDSVIISLHNHNDRGESVAQCELGLLAGAERVEGCLFGNGERTGNLDIVTVALNMFTQGVDPKLDFSDLKTLSKKYSHFTNMEIHPRTPYAGELVFTAFSGSHQDAIRKAMHARVENKTDGKNVDDDKIANGENNTELLWDVPYLAIDPHDIGREYEGIIRINSQSGKGGAAFILENDFGIVAPKQMHSVIGEMVQSYADKVQREITNMELYRIFSESWLETKEPLNVLEISERHIEGERGSDANEHVIATATIEWQGKRMVISGSGNGPLDAFVTALKRTSAPVFNISSFHEHSIGTGSDTHAMAYVELTFEDGHKVWGVGKSSNVGRAGIAAVVSAVNFRKSF